MSLREYQRKRKFDRTPEPEGSPHPACGNSFVVQKHHAGRLHYDFRLELDGVLKSWAVPKGPSLDPAVKRLAVHVEDHPVEYGAFEGIIPKGEYGGGTVMLWDRGTWEPTGEPLEGYQSGRLKFKLHGDKLRGAWMLVRTGGSRSGTGHRQWLLFKERDDEAKPHAEGDILQEQPLSAATGRSLEQIAADKDWVWGDKAKSSPLSSSMKGPADLLGAKAGKLPTRIDVQLPKIVKIPPEGDLWLHEIMFAGYRMICRIDRGEVQFLTRDHKNWTERIPSLAAAAARLPVTQAILDGEIVALRHDGTTDLQDLETALREDRSDVPIYYAFDLLYLDGHDLRRAPLEERKRLLAALVPKRPSSRIRFSDHVEGSGEAFFNQACKMGLAGVISKRRDRPYRPGRAPDWRKCECPQKSPPRPARPKKESTRAGKRRKPAMNDVDAREYDPRARQLAGVRLTSPDKILYPEHAITKLELANYYREIAGWILPHLANRPLVLVRCPEGLDHATFYQKHPVTGTPEALRRISIRGDEGTKLYVVADDVAGLISLAQIAALEIHAWGSRADLLEKPDRLIFDLDPDPRVSWDAVVGGAHQIRQLLQNFGLQSFVKTTGGKGLHIVVPIERRHEWSDVKAFCREVAELIVSLAPRHYTANMAKAARTGKIYIDYLRNTRGSTAVAPYSTRARPGAPVSTPLTWDELRPALRSDYYTIRNLPRRLASLKSDPWQDIATVRQNLSGALDELRALRRIS